jgi:flagellar biosynthesis protein FlhG
MHDQAAQLRAMVRSATQADVVTAHAPPRKIVVCGAKGGVGTTTIAVDLSIALARQGARVVLVDADMNQPDVAALCQIEPCDSIADVLSARRTVHEALHRGPAGVQILPGIWSSTKVPDCSPAAQERLLSELDRLGKHADLIVLDVGSGLNHVVRRFWQAAERVLLIMTPDRIAIVDAYAAIKVLGSRTSELQVELVVNRAETDLAAATHLRIDQACQRFLNRSIELAGYVAADDSTTVTTAWEPSLLAGSETPRAHDIRRIAERLLVAGTVSVVRGHALSVAAA